MRFFGRISSFVVLASTITLSVQPAFANTCYKEQWAILPGSTLEIVGSTPGEVCDKARHIEELLWPIQTLISLKPIEWGSSGNKLVPIKYDCTYELKNPATGATKIQSYNTLHYYKDVESTGPGWAYGATPRHDDCTTCAGSGSGSFAAVGGPGFGSSGFGHPIDYLDLSKTQTVVDWQSPRDPRFAFVRHYSSSNDGLQSYSAESFGQSWWSQFERTIWQQGNTHTLYLEQGVRREFFGSTGISYPAQMKDHPYSMSRDPATGFKNSIIYAQDGQGRKDTYTEYLNFNGTNSTNRFLKISEMSWADGYRIAIVRDSNKRIASVSDNKGQRAEFTWLVVPNISPAVAVVARIDVDLDYDGVSFVPEIGIEYTYEAPEQFPYGVVATAAETKNNATGAILKHSEYDYDLAEGISPARLRAVRDGRLDATGQPFDAETFTYGRQAGTGDLIATSTELGGSVARYESSMDPSYDVTVTNPYGKETVLDVAYIEGRRRILTATGAPTTSCLGTSVSADYTTPAGMAQGWIYSRAERNGSQTTYTRDSRGLPLTITEDAGGPVQRVTTYTWHPTLRLPLTRTTSELKETFAYSPEGLVTSYSQQDMLVGSPNLGAIRTWTYGYTPLANGLKVMTSLDGPGLAAEGVNDVTTYTYTPLGELATVTDPNGLVTTVLSRNAQGQATVVEEPNGNRWTFAYDPLGRVLTAGVAGPGETPLLRSFTYDIAGLITGYTDTRGAAWAFTYDEARRLTKTVAPMNDITTYGYDAAGNVTLTEVRRGSGAVTFREQSEFDELGRLLRSIGAMGQQWTYAHDVEDNLSKVTDPLNKSDSFGYDALNRLIDVVDRRAAEVTMDWDSEDRMTSYTDQRAIETTYTYNGFGDLISEISPDRGRTDYGYDDRGLVISRTDGRSATTLYSYDNGGRPVLIDYLAGNLADVRLSYDQAKLGVPVDANKGSVSEIADGTIRMEFGHQMTATYERIRTKTTLPGGRSYLTLEDFDFEGDSPRIVLPSGTEVNYTRNAAGKVSRVRVKIGGTWRDVASSITYAPDGPLVGMTYGDGIPQTRTYDLSYRLTALADGNAGTTLRQTGYGYDSRDNITSITDGLLPANNETYGYSPREELTSAVGPYGTLGYTYNLVGSRRTATLAAGTDNYTYPAANNRLSSISLGAGGSRSFTYDGAGNTVTDSRNSGTVYAYDSAGRLASVTTGGVLQATYRYDMLGRQVLRTLVPSGVTIQSIFDSQGRRVAEYDQGTGALIREYVWLDWEPLAVIEGGTIFYVRADHIGRPVLATSASGAKVWTMSFDPFGNLIASNGNPIAARFPGQWFQAESGLHQNWMRDYDPTTGRYIQPDPLGLIDGSSVYGYAGQNPGRWTDPSGEDVPTTNPPPGGMAGQPNWTWLPDPGNSRGGAWQGSDCKACTASWDETYRHWDVDDGKGNRVRYNWRGYPMSIDEAHIPHKLTPRLPPLMGPLLRCIGIIGSLYTIYDFYRQDEIRYYRCVLSGRCT